MWLGISIGVPEPITPGRGSDVQQSVDGHHMRSTITTSRWGTCFAFLLALGMLSGSLSAGDVLDLPPPGEEIPAKPEALDTGLFGLEGNTSQRKEREPEITVTWAPLSGHPETAVLAVHVKMQADEHAYDIIPVKGTPSKPTKITVEEIAGATPLDQDFIGDRDPELIAAETGGAKMREYLGEVTFLRRYRLTSPAPSAIAGKIDVQVCTENSCRLYHPALTSDWSAEPYTGAMPAAWKPAGTPASKPAGTPAGEAASQGATTGIELEKSEELSAGYALFLAFIGGILMNFMPCVLPVIAIKILSFVEQAGESRSRIFALNLTYSMGVILVFLGLGTLATFAKIGQGQLFQFSGFTVLMAGVVFAMGLSLLGVFEFQLPGSVGGAGSSQKEGLTGAFFTGILATLLATPCIGPFVGSAVFWSVKQPIGFIYLVWGLIGLGMAVPYLLIGAFPSLINRMPRPGMWMVRFKEFSGFVLMATVIWIIQSISPDLLIPTLVILLGVALGLWMIGNLYDHSSSVAAKWKVRIAALAITLPLFGFGVVKHLGPERMAKIYAKFSGQEEVVKKPETRELPWEPFSPEKFLELRKAGKPVLIDFTANWCLVCKSNEYFALNTVKTAAFVKDHHVTCFQADFTKEDSEIKAWIEKFGASGIPLTVVYPPGEKAKGFTFDTAFTESGLHRKMEDAWQKSGWVPAQSATAEERTAQK